jgi:hypothetical protein
MVFVNLVRNKWALPENGSTIRCRLDTSFRQWHFLMWRWQQRVTHYFANTRCHMVLLPGLWRRCHCVHNNQHWGLNSGTPSFQTVISTLHAVTVWMEHLVFTWLFSSLHKLMKPHIMKWTIGLLWRVNGADCGSALTAPRNLTSWCIKTWHLSQTGNLNRKMFCMLLVTLYVH